MMNILKKVIIPIIGAIMASIIVVMLSQMIFKGGYLPDKYNKGMKYYKAIVTNITSEELEEDVDIKGIEIGNQVVDVEFKEGPFKGQEYEIENPISRLYNLKVEKGTKVIVGCYESNDKNVMAIYSYDRSNTIYILIGVFCIIVIVIGGIKGVKSLISLMFTLVCCIFLMIPLMLRGVSPILASILMAILSITVTLLLVAGFNKKSLTAILGTTIGVIISGAIAYIFGNLSKLSGLTMENAESLIYIAEDTGLKIKGLMFAGILVASLGAVMDVAMSISSSIFEINDIDKTLKFNDLFMRAMNIGKDIIGTMTNTLILAFAGGSISLLLFIYSAQMPYNKLINLDVLGIEIIQGFSGSIGIILSVPITALIGSYFCKNKNK